MKNKNLVRRLSVCAATCMILVGGVVPSFANNYTDTVFQFDFGLANGIRYTDGRAKTDKSKSYMKCNTITSGYSYSADVYASLSGGDSVYCGTGTSYTFNASTGGKYLTNYVRENGYTAAKIGAKAGFNIKNVTATGVWSPDNYYNVQG